MKIIGHRGARNEAPENTIQGFVHAQNNGCEHFELDIQLSSDYQLIVYHDKSLKRTSGIPTQLKQLNSFQLNQIDARLNTPGWKTPCFIPTLEQVISAADKTKSWQFEVKTDSRHAQKITIRKLIELFEDRNLYDAATVTSSHRWLLWELKRLKPNIRTGYVAEWRYNRPVKTATRLGCDLLVLNHKLASPALVRRAKQANLEVSCWTVNNIARGKKLESYGVDSLITDIPTSTLEHFKD